MMLLSCATILSICLLVEAQLRELLEHLRCLFSSIASLSFFFLRLGAACSSSFSSSFSLSRCELRTLSMSLHDAVDVPLLVELGLVLVDVRTTSLTRILPLA